MRLEVGPPCRLLVSRAELSKMFEDGQIGRELAIPEDIKAHLRDHGHVASDDPITGLRTTQLFGVDVVLDGDAP